MQKIPVFPQGVDKVSSQTLEGGGSLSPSLICTVKELMPNWLLTTPPLISHNQHTVYEHTILLPFFPFTEAESAIRVEGWIHDADLLASFFCLGTLEEI